MNRVQEIADKRPALKALGLEVCACGQPKRRKQYFCRTCWHCLRGAIPTVLNFPYRLGLAEGMYTRALAELEEAGRLSHDQL